MKHVLIESYNKTETRLPCHCQSNSKTHSPERTTAYENLYR